MQLQQRSISENNKQQRNFTSIGEDQKSRSVVNHRSTHPMN